MTPEDFNELIGEETGLNASEWADEQREELIELLETGSVTINFGPNRQVLLTLKAEFVHRPFAGEDD